jgi:hypothetical protein
MQIERNNEFVWSRFVHGANRTGALRRAQQEWEAAIPMPQPPKPAKDTSGKDALMAALGSLIGATSTKAGLEVCAELDTNTYPAGIKVTDAELAAIAIERHSFHGEWNYTLRPRPI